MKIITIEEHYSSAIVSEKMGQMSAHQTDQNASKAIFEVVKRFLPNNEDIQDVGERRIKFMDESGIAMQVISYGNGNPQTIADAASAIELCQQANNELSALIKQNPTRFAGFAALPVADPIAAAAELDRAVNELGLKGSMIAGTFQGQFFDDPRFLPIFAKAAELKVPIYMHPAIIAQNISDYYFKNDKWSTPVNAIFASAGFGWHMDSGIHVIRMILSGIFDKFPDLNLISGHWGEFAAFYLERMDDTMNPTTTGLERKISEYYKNNVYITPSGIFSVPQLQFAITEMGADHIIYSGDYPYLIDKTTGSFLENAPISKEDKEKIGHLNVEKLLGL